MAEGRQRAEWLHTAHVMTMIAAGCGAKCSPADFPFPGDARPDGGAEPTPGQEAELEAIFPQK